jgi:hypothetical protein
MQSLLAEKAAAAAAPLLMNILAGDATPMGQL